MEVKKLPEFTHDEYIYTSKPYEYVVGIQDVFRKAQEIKRLDMQAKEQKLTRFTMLLKEYEKSTNNSEYKVADNMTNFMNLEKDMQQLRCGRFTANETGVKVYESDRLTTILPQVLTLTKRFKNIVSNELKAEIAFRRPNKKHWTRLIVNRDYLYNARKIVELSNNGLSVTSKYAPYVVEYLALLDSMNDEEQISERKSITKMGWSNKEYNNFVPYAKGIEFDGEGTLKTVYNAICEHGNYQKWLDCANGVRQGDNECARIMLSASFASVLLQPLEVLPFFVHVLGRTGTAKTVMLMLCASVWGNPSKYVMSFDSTQVGKDEMASMLNNLPFCLDELQIIRGSKYNDTDSIIYKLTEGISRLKGARNGGVQEIKTWKNVIITTGEQSILKSKSGGGALNRVVELTTYGRSLIGKPIETVDIINKNYGIAGKKFVEYLIANEDMFQKIKEDMMNNIAQLRDKGITDKQCISASLILAVDKVLSLSIFTDSKDKVLETADILPYLTNEDDMELEQTAYNEIMEWVTSNKHRFAVNSEPIEKWGKLDDGNVFIMSSIFNKFMEERSFDIKSFLEWARSKKLIEANNIKSQNRLRKNMRFGDMTVWGVSLKYDKQPPYTEISVTELPENF